MRNLSLLLTAVVLASCGAEQQSAPDLPVSVSPGWTRKAVRKQADACWQVDYASGGTATVSVCRVGEAVAFDKLQRTPAAGDTVKFQEGKYFVLVKWQGVSQTEIGALVRAIQKTLKS